MFVVTKFMKLCLVDVIHQNGYLLRARVSNCTESHIIEYFINNSYSKFNNNEDNHLDYELEK